MKRTRVPRDSPDDDEPIVHLAIPLKALEVLETLLARELRSRGLRADVGLKSWAAVQISSERGQNAANVASTAGDAHAALIVTPLPLLADKAEAARLLGCSTSTLDRLRKEGAIVPVKLGSSTKYRVRDLEAYVEALPPGGGGWRRRLEGKVAGGDG